MSSEKKEKKQHKMNFNIKEKLKKTFSKEHLKEVFTGEEQKKHLKQGSYSSIMTVIVLAVIVVINLIVAQIPTSKTQIDLSTQKMYSITDETKTALKDLDQDVTLYYIVQKGSEDDTIEKLLEHYDELSDHIKVETKDPGLYPKFTSQYTDQTVAANSVIVRLQAPLLKSVSIHWPQDAIWTSRAPRTAYSADSCSSAAFLREPIDELRMSFLEDGQKQEITIKRLDQEFGKALVQLVANMRMVASKDAEEQEYLGIRYNLAGPRTNFLLVVERAEEDKVADFAKLSVVPQMPVVDRMCNAPFGDLEGPGDISYCMSEPIRKYSRASHLGHWHASRATRRLDDPLEMMIDEDFEEEDPDGVNSTFFSGETEEIAKQLIDAKHLVELWEIAQKNDELKKKNCRKLLQKLEELADSSALDWYQIGKQLSFLIELYHFMEIPGKQTLSLFNELRIADERLNERWPDLRDFAKYMRKEHASWLTDQFKLFETERQIPEALADIVKIPTLQDWDNTDERNFVDAILTMLFVVNFVLDSENKEVRE